LREYDTPKGATGTDNHHNHDQAMQAVINEEKKADAACDDDDDCSSNKESEMRGVHARFPIGPNQICMAIPRKCLITVEMGQATPLGAAILQSELDLDAPKHIFLMIYLLWDRKTNGASSFFHPYYEILPKTLSNMPIFWNQDERNALQGSFLLQQIDDRNEAIAEDYHTIAITCPQLLDLCTLDEFKWARMCVCSRNFGLQIDGHRTSALVPHADMLNHYRPRETKWTFDEERQAFTITSLQPIPAGAQVYDSYGQKCNHRFLLNYGFAVEDNRELDGFCPNEVPLEVGVQLNDPLYLAKMEFWTRGESSLAAHAIAISSASSSLSIRTPYYIASTPEASAPPFGHYSSPSPMKRVRVCVSNNENTRLLFSLLRALACNEQELASITNNASPEYQSRFPNDGRSAPFYRSCRDIRHPISIRNEREAMTLLMELIARVLEGYPTTLAQDVMDLQDEALLPRFSNKRHAKIQVRGEKEVLHHFLRWARTALEVMNVIDEELKVERGDYIFDEGRASFDYLIREMEQEDHRSGGGGGNSALHHTIVRYCVDVLGSLRREELKALKRKLAAY